MEFCVITDIKNGIGNIVLEILVGLYFSKRLSLLTGNHYKYYGYLTDACMRGHSIIYTKDHESAGMPHPLDMSSVFPNVKFIKELPNNLHNHHLCQSIDIGLFQNSKMVNICVNHVEQTLLDIQNNLDILDDIKFNPNIYNYTRLKYNPTNKSIAIHVRLPQIGDSLNSNYPSIEWYKNAIKLIKEKHGSPDKVFLITGISTAHNNTQGIVDNILSLLNTSFDGTRIINVTSEPYYVDMCILSLSRSTIITNSTFSLSSVFNEYTNDKIVIYPDILCTELKLVGFYRLNTS